MTDANSSTRDNDASRTPSAADPKSVDQPSFTASGMPTENLKFAGASARRPAALVRVYEKLRQGIWSDKGLFALLGYEYEKSGQRKVFKFKMQLADIPDEPNADDLAVTVAQFRRAIPSWVKQIVYKRDRGQCVLCGSQDQLHFDHDLPHSKGGTGLKPENVRILCARHNLSKGARIE